MKFLGIDPGLNGAIALYTQTCDSYDLETHDIPTHEITVNGRKRNRVDLHSLARIVANLAPGVELAIIEDVHAMPKQGVTSSFSFGFVAGAIQGVVAANNLRVQLVQPGPWKRYFGVTADKDSSRRCASQLFPAYSHLWARKKDDGRAEAAILAYYGERLHAQILS
jgi:crossover junction endodeoxyribonuclease RuvC